MTTLTENDAEEPPSLVDTDEVREAKAQAESQARASDDAPTRVPITIVTGKVF